MIKANLDLRGIAAANGIPLWRIAEKMGIDDSALSRMMRKELSDEKKELFKNAVTEIVKESMR